MDKEGINIPFVKNEIQKDDIKNNLKRKKKDKANTSNCCKYFIKIG